MTEDSNTIIIEPEDAASMENAPDTDIPKIRQFFAPQLTWCEKPMRVWSADSQALLELLREPILQRLNAWASKLPPESKAKKEAMSYFYGLALILYVSTEPEAEVRAGAWDAELGNASFERFLKIHSQPEILEAADTVSQLLDGVKLAHDWRVQESDVPASPN